MNKNKLDNISKKNDNNSNLSLEDLSLEDRKLIKKAINVSKNSY